MNTKKNLRALTEWASDYERVDAIIDDLIDRIDSGKMPTLDLPPIPASIKIIFPSIINDE